MTLQRTDNNDPFAHIPFVTTARGANHKQNDSSEQSTISLPTTHQNNVGFNNTFSPGANGHQANPLATLTDNEQFQVVYSNQTLSGVNSGNMLKPQNANNHMGSDSNEGLKTASSTASSTNGALSTDLNAKNQGLEKESSTDGSSKQLTDTGRYNGFSLANDVKSQNHDLDDDNTQASAAPTNSPKANNESN
jgi:hypothetical protein